MDMTKMFACKLCGSDAMVNHTCSKDESKLLLDSAKIDMGVLGELKVNTFITMGDNYNITTQVTKNNQIYPEMEHNITIKYCPFCGRELDD